MSLTLPEEDFAPAGPEELSGALRNYDTPMGRYLGAKVGQGWFNSLIGQATQPVAPSGAILERERVPSAKPFADYQTQEQWKASPQFREGLPFEKFMTEDRARGRAEVFDDKTYRDWLISQRQNGVVGATLGFGAALVGGLPDPVNYIPLGFSARLALMAKASGFVGKRFAPAFLGNAAEAGAATALTEPLLIGALENWGDDFTWADVAMDIALGAATGGVIGLGVESVAGGRAASPAPSREAGQPGLSAPEELGAMTGDVAPGMVRFYHGGSLPTEAGETRWVTPDPQYARDYRGGPNEVFYVDIPEGDAAAINARMWDDIDEAGQTNMVGRYGNTELPPEWAARLEPLAGALTLRGAGPIPDRQAQEGVDSLNVMAADLVHNREPQAMAGSAAVGPFVPVNDHADVVDRILRVAVADREQNGTSWFGIRVEDVDPSEARAIGAILPESRRWEDGNPQEETIGGTSAVGIETPTVTNVENALKIAGIRDGAYEGYYGKTVYVVASDVANHGEDRGEIVMRRPRVIAIFKRNDTMGKISAAQVQSAFPRSQYLAPQIAPPHPALSIKAGPEALADIAMPAPKPKPAEATPEGAPLPAEPKRPPMSPEEEEVEAMVKSGTVPDDARAEYETALAASQRSEEGFDAGYARAIVCLRNGELE